MRALTLPRYFLLPHLTLRSTDNRSRARLTTMVCILLLVMLVIATALLGDSGLELDLAHRKLAPCLAHPFGTDWLGRDMLTRTLLGLCRSLAIGLLADSASSIIAILLGSLAATLGPRIDRLVSLMIDTVMALPHLVLLILIAFACGGGSTGIVVAVALSHWPRLARIIRAEVLQLREAPFVLISYRLGHSRGWVARHHLLPHLLPQFLVGLILMFPHAILHAAGLTFLGFGLNPHEPSIGMLLAESMRHLLTGYWWLAVLPGLTLVMTVKLFDMLGNSLRLLLDPKTAQE